MLPGERDEAQPRSKSSGLKENGHLMSILGGSLAFCLATTTNQETRYVPVCTDVAGDIT